MERAIRRRPSDILRDLDAKRYHLRVMRDLAAKFAAIDMRPFSIVNGEIVYERPLNIPESLNYEMHSALIEVRALEHEYCGD